MNTLSKSYLGLFTGLLIIGFGPILVRLADAHSIVSVFYRLLIGTLVLFVPFVRYRVKSDAKLVFRGISIAVLAGVAFGIDMIIWALGVECSNVTLPTLFGNLAPVWVALGSILIFRERRKFGFWIGILVTVFGAIALMWDDLYTGNNQICGMLYGLLAGIFYAVFYLLTQEGRKTVATLDFLFLFTVGAAIAALIGMLVFRLPFVGYAKTTYYNFIFYALSTQVLAWYFINYSQGTLKATVVSPTLLMQPVIAGIFAIFILGEQLTVWQIVGGIIVVSGIYLVHFFRT
ncbi:DMT family transporter [Bacteroidales bacterium]|nr:DMT family transporter [Bacteroidales bacterium]